MEGSVHQGTNRNGAIAYCVTGATGYIGSWLVTSLLQKGYTVHATARDPAKVSGLLSLWSSNNRLKVFRADLEEEGSFDMAVKDCHGVFHAAASMEFDVSVKSNIENYVQSHILDPAIKGTINLLKACMGAKSVRRVVFTSSISTITAKENDGRWRPLVDESCQVPIDQVWTNKAKGWVYVLSKLVAEEAAFQFAKQNDIHLVSLLPTTVGGPFLTPTVPASVRVLLSPITGDPEFYSILCAVNARLGSISLVHIEDICNAYIFLMEQSGAEGQYICSAHSSVMSQLEDCLTLECPYLNKRRSLGDEHGSVPSKISSKKLTDLGFKYKYGLGDIIQHSITCCVQHGFLNHQDHNGVFP